MNYPLVQTESIKYFSRKCFWNTENYFGKAVTDLIITVINIPAHSLKLVQEFSTKHNVAQFREPPNSPNMAPCYFWLVPSLKMLFKGHRFNDKERVETNTTSALKVYRKTAFQDCFWK